MLACSQKNKDTLFLNVEKKYGEAVLFKNISERI